MSIVRLSATDIELILSGWPDNRFVSLCNALVWAYGGRSRTPLSAAFTENEKAKDLGIDAEVELEGDPVPGPFLSKGWNVFQYKRRSAVSRPLAGLRKELTGAVDDVARRAGRHPSSYALFTNLHLTGSQSEALRQVLLEGYPAEQIRVSVNGAAGIAAMLADLPHIRAAFFDPARFERWQDAWDRLRCAKLGGMHVELVGRDKELAKLRRWMDDPAVRVILVHGPHDVGKDRLILEATKHGENDVLVSVDPEGPDFRDLREIGDSGRDAVLIVEDLDRERLSQVLPQVLSQEKLKLFASLPTRAGVSLPDYGFDPRVQTLALDELDASSSMELLKKAGAHLDYSLAMWVVEHAGGIPGVLLSAASIGRGLRETAGDFWEQVGREFERRVAGELGEAALDALRVFSLLARVAETEIADLAKTMGQDPSQVRDEIHDLQASGLLQKKGPFYEVNPPVLAQYLASRTLTGGTERLYGLLVELESPARVRLLKRLAELPSSPELEQFWSEMLGPGGICKDRDSFRTVGHLLPTLAEAAPGQTLACLQRIVRPLSLEERKDIAAKSRRDLVEALDTLLLWPSTAAGAARVLLLLAEAEMFFEFFLPLHPQVAALLAERVEVLREALVKGTEAQQLLAVEAIRKALRPRAVALRRSSAFVPPDRPAATYGELYDYAADFLRLLVEAGAPGHGAVPDAARKAIPEVAQQVAGTPRSGAVLDAFRRCLDWLHEEEGGIEPAAVEYGLHQTLAQWETREEMASQVQEGRRILVEMENLGFARQVQRWTGERRLEEWEQTQAKLRVLAQQVVDDPDRELLTEDLLNWLLSESNRASRAWVFFLFLGELDGQRRLLPKFEVLAKEPRGTYAFRPYCAAWGRVDPKGLAAYLAKLDMRTVCWQALVYGLEALPAESRSLERVLPLLGETGVDPFQLAEILTFGEWMKVLVPEAFLNVLSFVAGVSFESSAAAIHLLDAWLDARRPVQGELRELAWSCLEADALNPTRFPHAESREWKRDRLAGLLAAEEPERGFRLLEKLMRSEGLDAWDPLGVLPRPTFWQGLLKADRPRAMRLVFGPASNYLRLGSMEEEVFDQKLDAALLTELALSDPKTGARITRALNFDRPGFWEIALPLVTHYAGDQDVESALDDTILSGVWVGEAKDLFERRCKEVRRVLQEPGTPSAAKPWLRRLEAMLGREVGQGIIWEYDLDVCDLKRFVDDKNAPERIWAIGRILKHAKWEDVQKLLTAQDIKDALPWVDLPERDKWALESAVEYWLHRA